MWYAAITPKPTILPFCCLLPFFSIYLREQWWILVEVNEKQSPRVPIFSEILRVPFDSFPHSFCLAFFSHRPNLFWNDQTNQVNSVTNVQKSRVVNTVSTSFNNIARKTTERSQRKNRFLHCSVNKIWSKWHIFQNTDKTTIISKCAKGVSSTIGLGHVSKSLP